MAFRVSDLVVDGEIDNTVKGRVTGWIQFSDRSDRVRLDLRGNCHPDLAGWKFRIKRLRPVPSWADPSDTGGLASLQQGEAGDITAAQRLKDHDCSVKELITRTRLGEPPPFTWRKALYLEWYSDSNGRVVIQDTRLGVEFVGKRQFAITVDDIKREEEENRRKLEELREEGWVIEDITNGMGFGFAIRKADPDDPDQSLGDALGLEADELERAIRGSLSEEDDEGGREDGEDGDEDELPF